MNGLAMSVRNARHPCNDMGHDFQAPKQTDVKQWKKVELLYQQGYAYHSCGGGPGYRPSRLSEVPEFLEIQRTFENKREALLYRILQS